ncbi:hypothetical protein DEJ31_06650 [Curtobacterium sp. MCPF17_031]|nr:hypothetical protein DEJ31_06650 [Curtobacterium sp. MCPF17_031]
MTGMTLSGEREVNAGFTRCGSPDTGQGQEQDRGTLPTERCCQPLALLHCLRSCAAALAALAPASARVRR